MNYCKIGWFWGFVMRRFALILIMLYVALLANCNGQVEYAPGERFAEKMFDMGFGKPWLISEHFPGDYGCNTISRSGPTSWYSNWYNYFGPTGKVLAEWRGARQSSNRVSLPLADKTFIGYIYVDSGSLTMMDADSINPRGIVKVYADVGSYPVFAISDTSGELTGIYVDMKR